MHCIENVGIFVKTKNMKNTIIVDVDSERERQIIIGKPYEIAPLSTPEEMKPMMENDITCLAHGLCELIRLASLNGYCDKETAIKTSIGFLNDLLTEAVPPISGDTK